MSKYKIKTTETKDVSIYDFYLSHVINGLLSNPEYALDCLHTDLYAMTVDGYSNRIVDFASTVANKMVEESFQHELLLEESENE
tara:strand:+ start:57 stop:308 length:252 start_codon:yes stop_codon:yes gene_type:complete